MIESYVVVHNIAKRHNVGTLARSATAFGVSEMILVGRRDFNAFGSHGSTSHVNFRHFHSLSDARVFLKSKDCDICGVEITDNAVDVTQHPFKKSTAFLLGNEVFFFFFLFKKNILYEFILCCWFQVMGFFVLAWKFGTWEVKCCKLENLSILVKRKWLN